MDHPEGARETGDARLGFDRRVRLEFLGTQLSSDGGLLVMRELDDALGLSDLASGALDDTRRGKNRVHRLDGLFRQSVYGRLAGYEDVNDADRLALDPVMRQVVGGRAVDAQAASVSQMGRFETETLALPENRAALADLNGTWIDRFHDRNGLKYITLDMDSSVSPTHGDQEGTAWNGHFDCTCYHPNFLFNQFGMLERCALRNGNVHSADGWRDVLDPVIARYAGRKLGGRFFRADAARGIRIHYRIDGCWRGVVLDGRPLVSKNGLAGHIGFITSRSSTALCGSGRQSTVESVAGGRAIAALAAKAGHAGFDAKAVFETHLEGHDWASQLIVNSANAIAELCANLTTTFGLERVAIGGSIGLASGYLDLVREALSDEPDLFRPKIVPTVLGGNSAFVGILARVN
jgi:hypothetical protein